MITVAALVAIVLGVIALGLAFMYKSGGFALGCFAMAALLLCVRCGL